MMGTMVRVMRFQSSVSLIGISGWMFRSQTLRFSGPVLKLKLFWNGTLIRSATGFCVFFARAVLVSWPDGAAVSVAWSGLATAARAAGRQPARRLALPLVAPASHLPGGPRRRHGATRTTGGSV